MERALFLEEERKPKTAPFSDQERERVRAPKNEEW